MAAAGAAGAAGGAGTGAAGAAGAAGGAGTGAGFDPKMLQQFGGMMGGGSGNNGGSQGNWMADIAKAQKDTWTQYIDSTQQTPQMGMPAASTAKTSSAPADNGRAEKISAIKDYLDAAARASELKKQQDQSVENKDLKFETA